MDPDEIAVYNLFWEYMAPQMTGGWMPDEQTCEIVRRCAVEQILVEHDLPSID